MREEKALEPSVGVAYSVRAAGWSIGRDQALSALREESGALQTGVRGAASGGEGGAGQRGSGCAALHPPRHRQAQRGLLPSSRPRRLPRVVRNYYLANIIGSSGVSQRSIFH